MSRFYLFHLVLCIFLISPLSAQESSAGRHTSERSSRKQDKAELKNAAPPAVVSMEVEVERGGSVLIPLQAIPRSPDHSSQILIRSNPQFGTLSEPRKISADTTEVVYSHDFDQNQLTDTFTFAGKSPSSAVSAAVTVQIKILQQPAFLTAPEEVLFPVTPLGSESSRTITFTNSGGVDTPLLLTIPSPWKLASTDPLTVPAYDETTVTLTFHPSTEGPIQDSAYLQSPNHLAIELSGIGSSTFSLVQDEKNPFQALLINETDSPLELEVFTAPAQHTDANPIHSPITLPPNGSQTFQFSRSPDSPTAHSLTLTVKSPLQEKSLTFSFPDTPPSLSLSSDKMVFPDTPLHETSSQTLTILNTGGQSVHLQTLLPADSPITIDTRDQSFILHSNQSRTISFSFSPVTPEPLETTLVLKATSLKDTSHPPFSQSLEVTASAKVLPAKTENREKNTSHTPSTALVNPFEPSSTNPSSPASSSSQTSPSPIFSSAPEVSLDHFSSRPRQNRMFRSVERISPITPGTTSIQFKIILSSAPTDAISIQRRIAELSSNEFPKFTYTPFGQSSSWTAVSDTEFLLTLSKLQPNTSYDLLLLTNDPDSDTQSATEIPPFTIPKKSFAPPLIPTLFILILIPIAIAWFRRWKS